MLSKPTRGRESGQRTEVTILWSLTAEVTSTPLCWLEDTGMGICGACLTFTKCWLPSPNTTQNQAWWHTPVILPFQHSRGRGKTGSLKPSSATQQGMIRCCAQNKGDWQFMEAFVLLSAGLFPLSGKGSQPLAYCFLGVDSSPARHDIPAPVLPSYYIFTMSYF